MTYKPARTTTHRTPNLLVAGLLVVAAIAAALGYSLLTSSFSTVAAPSDITRGEPSRPQLPPRPAESAPSDSARSEPSRLQLPPRPAESEAAAPSDIPRHEHSRPQLPPRSAEGAPSDIPRGQQHSALGDADGIVPDGTTVFDDEVLGVANLDPALLSALRQAAIDAADDGVEFFVDSGWRSPEYQNQLLREAVSQYGSEEEAARWVATAETSPHVSGAAVDIGPFDARAWLSEHGAEYGLCQIYSNEPWHYELRPEAIDHGCPPLYADPTHDPRMQQ